MAPFSLPEELGIVEFVNADEIARGLSGFNPEGVALAAGKIILGRLDELFGKRESFAFETTLASRTFAPWIRRLKESGYRFHLVYLFLSSVNLAENRVLLITSLGGHSVPPNVIRRAYITLISRRLCN